MNVEPLAKDLISILKEQMSIMKTIYSFKRSLEKLGEQKRIPEDWKDMQLSIQPAKELHVVLNKKRAAIEEELQKLRLEQTSNLRKMDNLRAAVERMVHPAFYRHSNNRSIIPAHAVTEAVVYASEQFLVDFYWSPEGEYNEGRYSSIVGEVAELLSACKFEE